MKVIELIAFMQVFAGAVIMLFSIALGIKIRTRVAKDLSKKWLFIIFLMAFFFFGYLFYLSILTMKIHFPLAFVTASIFFGGACFVYIIVKLTETSIHNLKEEMQERKALQDHIFQAKREWEETFDIINDAITIHDAEFNIIRANKAAEKMLNMPFVTMFSQKCYKSYHGTESPPENCPSCRTMKTGIAGTTEVFEPHLNKCIEIKALPRFDKDGRIIGVVHVLRDITRRKRMEEKLHVLSITDELTHLYNRRGFFTMAEQQIKIAKRMQRGMLLFSADLDHLKMINDTYGHTEGDLALRETADILRETFRESDILARIGGDEFVILQLEDIKLNAEQVAGRLQRHFDEHNAERNKPYTPSLSIGITYYNPAEPSSLEELLARADKLMYDQKRSRQQG